MRISIKLSIICMISVFCLNSEGATPVSIKNKEEPIDVNHALAQSCPLLARQAIDDFKRGPIKNKDSLIPYYEKSYSEQFEPVKCFFNNPSNSALFSKALDFAKKNRDYDVARVIIDKTPESFVKKMVPNIKEVLMEDIAVSENNEAGTVLFSNRMVKVFTAFPSTTHSFTNCPRTFCVEWEEQLNYSNRLHLVNIASGRRVQLLKNLVDAQVLWSTSGRYIAVQWRTSQWMRESEFLGKGKTLQIHSNEPFENMPLRRCQISLIDTLSPNKITQLDDFLPELARQSTRMDYTIEKWESDSCVSVSSSWFEGSVVVYKRFHLTLEVDGKLKVRIENQ
jgi:hypothetical protein